MASARPSWSRLGGVVRPQQAKAVRGGHFIIGDGRVVCGGAAAPAIQRGDAESPSVRRGRTVLLRPCWPHRPGAVSEGAGCRLGGPAGARFALQLASGRRFAFAEPARRDGLELAARGRDRVFPICDRLAGTQSGGKVRGGRPSFCAARHPALNRARCLVVLGSAAAGAAARGLPTASPAARIVDALARAAYAAVRRR